MAALTHAAQDAAGAADTRTIAVGLGPVPDLDVQLVSASRVAQLCGYETTEDTCVTAAEIASGIVGGYVRWNWTPDEMGRAPQELRTVALAVALRLVLNLAQWDVINDTAVNPGENTGSRTYRREGSFKGFTLAETMILDRFRRRSG